MSNLYDALDRSAQFNKYKVDDLLFVEYTCEPGGPRAEIWSHSNYFTYVVTGKMILKGPEQEYLLRAGESYFIKRGAFVVPQFFEETFCDMIIFLTDDFIRKVINKYDITLTIPKEIVKNQSVIPLHLDHTLISYYQSLFGYFKGINPPAPILLEHRFEELILNILTNSNNPELACYLIHLQRDKYPGLKEIMENNYNANLSLSEYARMSARSLSKFRRDFQKIFHAVPGEWLREKRLQHSAHLLKTTNYNMDEIAHESGFRSRTHFSKCFKTRFTVTPNDYRHSDQR